MFKNNLSGWCFCYVIVALMIDEILFKESASFTVSLGWGGRGLK